MDNNGAININRPNPPLNSLASGTVNTSVVAPYEEKTIETGGITREYIHKPTILLNIAKKLASNRCTTGISYKDDKGEIWQTTTVKLERGAEVFFRYPGSDKSDLYELVETVSYVMNNAYPGFDRLVGGGFDNVKFLAQQAGLSKRWQYQDGEKTKLIDSYDPKTLKTTKEKLHKAGRVTVEFDNLPIRYTTNKLTKAGKVKKITKEKRIKSSAGALVDYIETDDRVMVLPNRVIMLHAYGESIETAIDLIKDQDIRTLPSKNYFPALNPSGKERKTKKTAYSLTEDTINENVRHLKMGETSRTIKTDDFRGFYRTKEDKEYKRLLKSNLARYKRIHGGKIYFTDRADKRGIKTVNYLPYVYVDFQGNKVYEYNKTQEKKKFVKGIK